MAEITCERNPALRARIVALADALATRAHEIPDLGISEQDLYQGGLFRAAVERLRGQYAATMTPKRDFVRAVLDDMHLGGFIATWTSAGEANRHDYTVTLNDGRISIIELKGCLDGDKTNIFTRPPHAQEFVLWSVCTNPGADPRHNLWSGIHTRLSAEIIDRDQRVDGLIVWDWLCGTVGRPCPKIEAPADRTMVGPYDLVPPCLYLFPPTVPSPRNNPAPTPNALSHVGFLAALHACFRGSAHDVNDVTIEVRHQGADTERRTTIRRNGRIVRQSDFTPIRRS